MATINISLPEAMKAIIERQVTEGHYSTASEYFRHLVREDHKRRALENLEGALVQGLNSGRPINTTQTYWRNKQKTLTAGPKKAKR